MKVRINRAPVLTLWAAVVAERMGHSWESAFTLGKAMAGLNAQAKGRTLGIYTAKPADTPAAEQKRTGAGVVWVTICGRPVPARATPEGLRAVTGDTVISAGSVTAYLAKAFGDSLGEALEAMKELAKGFSPEQLDVRAWGFYEIFRPVIASGTRGWGQKGELDLDLVRSLAAKKV
jgi:hypothetical protein